MVGWEGWRNSLRYFCVALKMTDGTGQVKHLITRVKWPPSLGQKVMKKELWL